MSLCFLSPQHLYREVWDKDKTQISIPSDTPELLQSKLNALNISNVRVPCGLICSNLQFLILHSHQRTTEHLVYQTVLMASSSGWTDQASVLWSVVTMVLKPEPWCFCASCPGQHGSLRMYGDSSVSVQSCKWTKTLCLHCRLWLVQEKTSKEIQQAQEASKLSRVWSHFVRRTDIFVSSNSAPAIGCVCEQNI